MDSFRSDTNTSTNARVRNSFSAVVRWTPTGGSPVVVPTVQHSGLADTDTPAVPAGRQFGKSTAWHGGYADEEDDDSKCVCPVCGGDGWVLEQSVDRVYYHPDTGQYEEQSTVQRVQCDACEASGYAYLR